MGRDSVPSGALESGRKELNSRFQFSSTVDGRPGIEDWIVQLAVDQAGVNLFH